METQKQEKCSTCKGTGFIGEINPPNTHMELMKIGCCNCGVCNGTGLTEGWSIHDLEESLLSALRISASKIVSGIELPPH